MKEKLKIEFDHIHNLLQRINSVAFEPDELDSKIFRSVLTGFFAKCIEFNFYILNKEKTGSLFLLSSLRSITEANICIGKNESEIKKTSILSTFINYFKIYYDEKTI